MYRVQYNTFCIAIHKNTNKSNKKKQYNASEEDFGRDICCKLIVYINNKAYKIKSMIGF